MSAIGTPPDPAEHPCFDPEGGFDHDWHFVSDTAGDSNVIDGVQDMSCWECRRCGAIDTEREPPDPYDFDDWRED